VSLESKIFKGVSWMALFQLFSNLFSWAITILIARILVPGDYGLMAMSTIITGYALGLSELGLGNAIIQRLNVSKNELSTVFWFSFLFTVILAFSCFPISYLTAYIMHDLRVIPITQTVSVIFILNGLQIVPSSIIRKEMDFKSIGLIDMICIIVSSLSMFAIAKFGGGVWTLIFGYIIRSFIRTVLLFGRSKWKPTLHFNFAESRPFISFGVVVALGRSLFYIQEKSDTFFAGRAWKSNLLGYYSFALQLAQIPTDRIVSLINNVSFPAFSKLQNDQNAFNKLYLNIAKVTAVVVFPLFLGGFILGGDLIKVILNPKWYPMITLFRFLCLSQILTGMNAINNFVHTAQGRPNWSLYYNGVSVVLMPISFYFAVKHGLNAIAIPWITTYLILCICWIFISINKFGIKTSRYVKNLMHPFCATVIMSAVLMICHGHKIVMEKPLLSSLGLSILGVLLYGGYFIIFDHKFILNLKSKLRSPV
jgi:O-antigen/teichoic acid export membrane protein